MSWNSPWSNGGIGSPKASQAEAEAGTEAEIRSFSPLRVFQAIAAKVAASIATLTLAYSSTVKSTQTVDSAGSETHVITDGATTATVRIAPNGALWLEQSGQTAGNARGAGAFDWQSVRNNATQVASGATSAAVAGENNTCSGEDSGLLAGNSNVCTSTISAICGGSSNSISNSAAFIGGGQVNSVTAVYGVVVGGSINSVAGNSGVIAGGSNNSIAASGTYGFATGRYNTSSADGASVFGQYGSSAIACSIAIGGGVASGQHQTYIVPLGKTTANATPTVLDILDTATNRPVLPAKAAWHFRGMCIAYGPSYKASAWSIEGVIVRDGSNDTRIVGTPTIALIAQDTEMSGCAVTATADNTNEALAITVTGLAATSIRWTCSTFISQTLQA